MNNSDDQLQDLLARARANRPDTGAAEFGFETRLMARLHAVASTDSIWAMVSWRLIPFLAIGVVTLTLWHAEVVTETNNAEQVAYVENPEALDSWNTLN